VNKALVRAFADLPNDHKVILDEAGLVHDAGVVHNGLCSVVAELSYTFATVAAALVYGRTTCPYCWRGRL
jgi:hypothetical protein